MEIDGGSGCLYVTVFRSLNGLLCWAPGGARGRKGEGEEERRGWMKTGSGK